SAAEVSTRQLSVTPSQFSSIPFAHASSALGLTASGSSSQSPGTSTYPLGCTQSLFTSASSPNPSPSSSAYQSTYTTSSSAFPVQSLSIVSQYSGAPGWISASPSSQSPAVRR